MPDQPTTPATEPTEPPAPAPPAVAAAPTRAGAISLAFDVVRQALTRYPGPAAMLLLLISALGVGPFAIDYALGSYLDRLLDIREAEITAGADLEAHALLPAHVAGIDQQERLAQQVEELSAEVEAGSVKVEAVRDVVSGMEATTVGLCVGMNAALSLGVDCSRR